MDKIEFLILKNLLHNEEYLRKVIPFIKSSYFEDYNQKIVFEEMSSFVTEYNESPTKEILSIEVENVYTGTITKTGKAYLTMVAVDDDNKPIPVPPLKLTNKIEERRYNDAEKRRQKRLLNKS